MVNRSNKTRTDEELFKQADLALHTLAERLFRIREEIAESRVSQQYIDRPPGVQVPIPGEIAQHIHHTQQHMQEANEVIRILSVQNGILKNDIKSLQRENQELMQGISVLNDKIKCLEAIIEQE